MSSSANRILKHLEDKLPAQDEKQDQFTLLSDDRYIRKSSSLVTDALQKGYDVMQLPDGDIIITETRTVTFQYHWNDNKGKFERAKSGSRTKKTRKDVSNSNVSDLEEEEIIS